MISLVSRSSPSAFTSGSSNPVAGSVGGGEFPALSCQVLWKMHDLAAADAEQDAQHLRVGDPLRECT